MARALSIYGEPVIADDHGVRHVWAKELGLRLASLQAPEGSWHNKAERWMEGLEVLDTSYALVALSICKEELDRTDSEKLDLLKLPAPATAPAGR